MSLLCVKRQPINHIDVCEIMSVADIGHQGQLFLLEPENPSKQQLLLFIQSLSSHEDFHLRVEGKCAIIFAETVQQFGILEYWPLITD